MMDKELYHLASARSYHKHGSRWHHEEMMTAQFLQDFWYHHRAKQYHLHWAIQAFKARQRILVLADSLWHQQLAPLSRPSTLPQQAANTVDGDLHQTMQPSEKKQPFMDQPLQDTPISVEELKCNLDRIYHQGVDGSDVLSIQEPLVSSEEGDCSLASIFEEEDSDGFETLPGQGMASLLGGQAPQESFMQLLVSSEEGDDMLDLDDLSELLSCDDLDLALIQGI